ncbi:MAG: hypothetical protein AABW51_02020 [Nanoarchaeota archaeon]
MKINQKEIDEEVERNFKERLEFIKFWANYVKTHNDEDWSEQQNIIINSQID